MRVYPLFRSLLFQLDPEQAHNLTLQLIRLAGNVLPINTWLRSVYSAPDQPVEAFGLQFTNPLGLAAGYDKDGIGWRGLATLGFGHIEVGTVTVRKQAGNPKPRLFRLVSDQALINRMGFPGRGAEYVCKKLMGRRPKKLVLGVNIGKNKDTPLEEAFQDYSYLLRLFAPLADYLTVNVSSPNTVGLRQLQAREALNQLLSQLDMERSELLKSNASKVPILVKLSPDLSDQELEDALDVIQLNHMDGVIATNTTLARQGIHPPNATESGGLSGEPLFTRSLDMVEKISKLTHGELPVIGVGGVSNSTGVRKMLDAGAVLVQIYTGLIYQGPGLVKRILQDL